LIPVMNLVPFWVDFAFRFDWIPVTVFCVTLVSVLSFVWSRSAHRSRVVLAVVFVLYLGWHGVQTTIQCLSFRSAADYWTTCLENFPDSRMCAYKLGQDWERRNMRIALSSFILEDRIYTKYKKSRGFYSINSLPWACKRLNDKKRASFFFKRAMLRGGLSRQRMDEAAKFVRENRLSKKDNLEILRTNDLLL